MNGVASDSPGSLAAAVMADVWDRVSIYDGGARFLDDLAALPDEKRHLLVALWCDYEIVNGGFLQLFWNSTGVLVPEAPTAYRALGLNPVASLIEESLKHFGAPYPRDREIRRQRFKLAPGTDFPKKGEFDSLDERYYDLLPGRDFDKAADSYAQAMPSN